MAERAASLLRVVRVFTLISDEAVERAKEAARAIALSVRLDRESDFDSAVLEQLSRLSGLSMPAKRFDTARKWAETFINPALSKDDIFASKDTVSKGIFYSTKKDWYHGEL